jgi:hypothetical protein
MARWMGPSVKSCRDPRNASRTEDQKSDIAARRSGNEYGLAMHS